VKRLRLGLDINVAAVNYTLVIDLMGADDMTATLIDSTLSLAKPERTTVNNKWCNDF